MTTPLRNGPPPEVRLIALRGMPLVAPGANLLALLCERIDANGQQLLDNDVLVVAQKVVSKAEGRIVDLTTVQPSERAVELALTTGKDARLVEMILRESRRVVRYREGVLIVEHRLGFICANAGIDQSNVDPESGNEPVLLLPENPDRSARELYDGLWNRYGCKVGVVINDSFGRPWRRGTVGAAIGAAGLPALWDLRGRPDLYARKLQATETGFADEIAASASLLMGQANEAQPVILIRGLSWGAPASNAAHLLRDPQEDLFR